MTGRGAEGAAMKSFKWARFLLCGLPMLAGCANFWQAPKTGGGGGGTTLSSGNFYVLNKSTTSQIAGYNIASGVLTALSGSPYAVTGQAFAIAVAPSGGFLYLSTTNGIYLYTIDATSGALTAKSVIVQDLVSAAIAVDPSGKWLLDASALGLLSAIPITSTGVEDTTRQVQALTALSGSAVQQMAISPDGALVAVALGAGGTQAFPFNSANAAPIGTAFSPTIAVTSASGGAAVSVAVDPQNRLLYVGETAVFPTSTTNSGGLRVFTIAATGLTEISGSPYASGGTAPHAIQPKSTGDFVYVANWAGSSTGNVTGFQLSTTSSTFSLAKLSTTVPTGTQPVGLAEDAKDNFILTVSSGGSPYFDAYIFDTTTAGKLDAAVSGTTGTGPLAIAAEP